MITTDNEKESSIKKMKISGIIDAIKRNEKDFENYGITILSSIKDEFSNNGYKEITVKEYEENFTDILPVRFEVVISNGEQFINFMNDNMFRFYYNTKMRGMYETCFVPVLLELNKYGYYKLDIITAKIKILFCKNYKNASEEECLIFEYI